MWWISYITTLSVVFGETPGIRFWKSKYVPAYPPIAVVPLPISVPVCVIVVGK